MFSLIIAIVSIALVVALVAATMYHGGDTLTQGRATADAAAFVTGAQQIGGAAVMHLSLDGESAANVAELVTDKYLAAAPVIKGVALELDLAEKQVVGTAVPSVICEAINKAAGAADATAVTAIGDLPYACISADGSFKFKY